MEPTGQGLPEEYKNGYAIFLGNKIGLSRAVLIPRPETEFWTRQEVNDLKGLKGAGLRVLDIFSGSGCVGIAVAKSLPAVRVDFAEISPEAIAQIRANIAENKISADNVKIFRSDIFKNIPEGILYDAILANPPYIDPARISEVQKSVLDYEPHKALFAKGGGLAVIDRFLGEAYDFLKADGFIYLEFDQSQREAVEEMAEIHGYLSVSFFKDQFGRWRFAKIAK